MYYLTETSLFLWGVVVPEWRWQVNEPAPTDLDAPDASHTPARLDGGGGAAAPATPQQSTGPQTPARAGQPGAPPPPADSEAGSWVLVGTTTRWYSTLLYNQTAAMTRQLAVQEDADADRRRGERDRQVTDRRRLA